MNSHEQYAALLDAFIDEALPEAESAQVRAHLAECPECQAYVSDALTMRELFPGVEETLVPDGFEEAVLSGLPPQNGVTQAQNSRGRTQARNRREQWRNGQRRTQWTKIALPLAACVTFVLLVGGILRGVPRPDGATEAATFAADTGGVTEAATFTAAGDGVNIMERKAVTAAGYDVDMDELAPESESDMDELAPESAEESVGVTESAENASAVDMDGGAAFGNGMDGGAMPDSVTNGGAAFRDDTNTSGAALKRAYEPTEEPETEESAVFDTGITAPTLYHDSADLLETSLFGASYDAVTDSADAAPTQSAESDTVPAHTAESDTMPPQSAETQSLPNHGDAAPPVTESAPESVSAEESVAVSFWTLSSDAASMLEQYPVSKETASGVWYALEPEQFDALRENLPESAFTPINPDSLPPDDVPPLRSRAPVYLFLPFTDSAP